MSLVSDVPYGEDDLRPCQPMFAEKLAWQRRFTLSLIKRRPGKDGVAMNSRMCIWNCVFLTQVLGIKYLVCANLDCPAASPTYISCRPTLC